MSMDKYTTLYLDNTSYQIRDNLEYKVLTYPYYKVFFLKSGESTYATNGLNFDTSEDAEIYGKELFFRWWGIDKWLIIRIDYSTNEHNQKVIERSIVPNRGQYE